MAETRVKLTEKQFAELAECGKKLMEAQAVFQRAQEYNKSVSELVLDAHGLTQDIPGLRIDEATKELVYPSKDAEATPAAPAPKPRRAKVSSAA